MFACLCPAFTITRPLYCLPSPCLGATEWWGTMGPWTTASTRPGMKLPTCTWWWSLSASGSSCMPRGKGLRFSGLMIRSWAFTSFAGWLVWSKFSARKWFHQHFGSFYESSVSSALPSSTRPQVLAWKTQLLQKTGCECSSGLPGQLICTPILSLLI